MTKAELIAGMASESGLTKTDAEKALNAFLSQVEQALKQGEKVQLVGFGSFEVKERAERIGRNPKTKEAIVIPGREGPGIQGRYSPEGRHQISRDYKMRE